MTNAEDPIFTLRLRVFTQPDGSNKIIATKPLADGTEALLNADGTLATKEEPETDQEQAPQE